MPRIERQHFVAAIETGIAACPILRDNPALASLLHATAQYANLTLIGRWTTGDGECPLARSGIVELDDSAARVRLTVTASTRRVLPDTTIVTPADFDTFWRAYDDAARPHVKAWDGDTRTPINVIN